MCGTNVFIPTNKYTVYRSRPFADVCLLGSWDVIFRNMRPVFRFLRLMIAG